MDTSSSSFALDRDLINYELYTSPIVIDLDDYMEVTINGITCETYDIEYTVETSTDVLNGWIFTDFFTYDSSTHEISIYTLELAFIFETLEVKVDADITEITLETATYARSFSVYFDVPSVYLPYIIVIPEEYEEKLSDAA